MTKSKGDVCAHSDRMHRCGPLGRKFGLSQGAVRKGQFFLVGAIILVILFYSFMLSQRIILKEPSTLGKTAENIKLELPRALNFGLDSGAGGATLSNFSMFAGNTLSGQLVNFSLFWLYTEGNSTTGVLNITAGNFLGHNTTVSLSTATDSTTLFVANNSTNATSLASTTSQFNLTIAFGTTNKTVGWQLDKVNMYSTMSFGRGSDIVKEELDV